jgi:hypothetical protein
MIEKEYFIERKKPLFFVIVLLVLASTIYFTLGVSSRIDLMSVSKNIDINNDIIINNVLTLLDDVQLKAAYTDDGNIDIFALAKNNELAKLTVSKGNSIPEFGGMVLGNVEGSMMQKEDEFKNIGDNIVDYNINFRIDGVLANTGTFVDDFHFISSENYNLLNADSDVLLVKFKDANTPKLFYLYNKTIPSPIKLEFSDGSINLFYEHIIDKKIYYPIIIGAKEAKMMQEEKLFSKVGDTIDDFFGRDVIIAGILKETNTNYDMMHIVESDFFDESTKSVKGVLV